MGKESLLRPQSAAGSAILTTSGDIGNDGTTIFMKVQSAQFNLSQSVVDTTGDGDPFANYDHNNELRGQISLRGFMLADNHIGINTLQPSSGSDKNPVRVEFRLGSSGSTDRKYSFKMMVTNIVIDWNRMAGLVGVAVQGQLTGSVAGTHAFRETS
jgi:hypothetical protein